LGWFGQAGQFRVHEFLLLFIAILGILYARQYKPLWEKVDCFNNTQCSKVKSYL
jgi:hypothetical protein